MSWGLTAAGFATETQAEVRDRLVSIFRAAFGEQVNVDTSSVFGQLIDIMSELIAGAEQQTLATYRSIDAENAIGVALDARAALTGSLRKDATRSTTVGTATGTPATVIANGSLVRLDATSTVWEVTNGPLAIPADGTLEGLEISAVEPGPTTALATVDWTIVTVVVGWTSFESTEDATPGRLVESDADFRLRRRVELYRRAQGPLLALTANVSAIEGVVRARAWHNPSTSPVDANGIPFKAFNVVVETDPPTPPAALRQSIADEIWEVMGAGGQAYGTSYTEVVVDSEGTAQPVSFDVIEEVDVWITVEITLSDEDEAITPAVEKVLAAYILEQATERFTGVGADLPEYRISGLVFESGVTGVTSVAVKLSIVDFAGPFLSPLVPISIRQRCDFDSTRIEVKEV